MVNRHTAKKIRKTHRYLGIFIGIQFLMWTMSGLYFSWTDLDEIHGDQFLKEPKTPASFSGFVHLDSLSSEIDIKHLELKNIGGVPYYWVNQEVLINARTGVKKVRITEEDAFSIAEDHMAPELEVQEISLIEDTGDHHEYRGQFLPVYVVSYKGHGNLKAYISARDGTFRSVRHRDWRWFDFLWMTHTMDYEGRDDFNNIILRSFSLLGLVTVMSGFLLWYISSPTVRRIFK